jgi:hypothetical protein
MPAVAELARGATTAVSAAMPAAAAKVGNDQ